jgi:hypothetical protein
LGHGWSQWPGATTSSLNVCGRTIKYGGVYLRA